MEKVDVIKITKAYEKENVVNAVKAYMTPKSDEFRLASECVGETYVVRLLGRNAKKGKKKSDPVQYDWVENCSVKLSFDVDTCTVGIFFQTYGAKEAVIIGAMTGIGMFVGFGIPLLIGSGLMAAKGGSDAVGSKRFRKDILKIVESFVCDETTSGESTKEKKVFIEKKNASKDSVYVCSCGKQLEEDQKFCPECGIPRDDGMRTCACGKQIKKSMRFCPYCGAVQE